MKQFFFISIYLLFSSLICFGSEKFVLPVIPDSLKTPDKRANYLLVHYWDNVDISNVILSDDKNEIEQFFVDYLTVLPIVDKDSLQSGLRHLVNKIQRNNQTLDYFSTLFEKYLYNVDSPMKNEELYLPFLETLVNSEDLNEEMKIRPRYIIESINKNRRGTKASDFNFDTRNDKRMSFYDIHSDRTILLIFYDPDCDHCKDDIYFLTNDSSALKSIKDNDIQIIAIYSGDNKALWDKTKGNLPEDWIVGYDDGTLQDEDLYIIRSLPAIYLIDKNKTVLRKEMQVKNICDIGK